MKRKRTAAGLMALILIFTGAVPVAGAQAAIPTVSAAAASANVLDARTVSAFLDRFFAEEQNRLGTAAAVVSVVKKGSVVAEKGYGKLDKESGNPVNPSNTTFRVGSVSKVFTVIALMQLVDQGKVGLQDNIEKYLDGYKLTNPFGKPVTVEMLLTHTTGFEVRDPTEANVLFDPSAKPVTLKESVFSTFPPVVREPRTSYMYDNFASQLVGYIVQKASGESFNEYMSKHIFAPLGMTSSTYDPAGALAKRLPAAYEASGEQMPDYRLSPEVLPEGSMITTAADMSKFMTSFLNGGKTSNGQSLLSGSSHQAMSAYQVSIHPSVPDMTYGFEAPAPLTDANGRFIIAKGGSIPGFESYMFLLPGEQSGVFVSTTALDPSLTMRLYGAFMDEFYPGSPKIGNSGYAPKPKSELARFEGVYRDLRLGILLMNIKASGDGTLTGTDQAGQQVKFKQVGDLLFTDQDGNPLAFKQDAQGRITYLKYANPGSYAVKLAEGTGFTDVTKDHPYARYIFGLQSLGVLPNDPSGSFGPDEQVNREEFIHAVMSQFGLPPSTKKPVFKDLTASPYQAEIQAAAELGLLTGMGNGLFEPKRIIKREEAAVITLKLLQISGFQGSAGNAKLAAGTSPWADEAVKAVVDLQIHGPEVTVSNGIYDYGSQHGLKRAELAAIQYYLMLPEQPLMQ